MQTSTSNGRRLVSGIAAALAAAALGAPAYGALAEAAPIGFRSADGAVDVALGGSLRDGWERRFGEPASTIGYRVPDGHLAVRRADTAIRDGWEAGLRTPVSTIGYRVPDGHLGSRAVETAIRDGWEAGFRRPESVIGYRSADGSVPEIVSVPRATPVADDGFRWSDAGVGAAVTLGSVLLALLAIAASRGRRRIAHA
jgi:hypothetical protein